jgi:predicted nuclease of predicted toxin-antitoxin system
MRFLADESCDFRVVRALREAGHDVMAVIEIAPGSDDAAVIDMAAREGRVFLTEDRDFGQLVYAAAKATAGVILLRFPTAVRSNPAAIGGGHRRPSRRKACQSLRRFATGSSSVRRRRERVICGD